MSVERFLKMNVTTAADVISGGLHVGHTNAATFDRWPAVIVPSEGTYQLYATSTDGFDTDVAAVDGTDEVWYPTETPQAASTNLVIGRDFDVAVFQSTSRKTAILRLEVPAPTISPVSNVSVAGSGNILLSWNHSFNVPTKVYRTALYGTTGDPPSDYDLITEVDPVTTPGTNATYTDNVDGATAGQYVSYFVFNENGKSDEIEVAFVA